MSNTETVTFTDNNSGPDAPQVAEEQPRVEGLPEKFNSVEDLVKSYNELEQKLGEPSEEENTQEEQEQQSAEEAVEQVQEFIGVEEFDRYEDEYLSNNGQLSEDSYKELQEKYNFSPDLIDAFIQGQEAIRDKSVSQVTEVVGGQENYNQILEWATDNLSEAEIDSYNDIVKEGNTAKIQMALQGVYSKYASENGVSPNLVQGGGKPRTAGYESKEQMVADMRKPEYKTDPAFREEVERRLANSSF